VDFTLSFTLTGMAPDVHTRITIRDLIGGGRGTHEIRFDIP